MSPVHTERSERSFVPTIEQSAAIAAPLTPMLLVAGAGAGKTTVMARRILHLVDEGLARADQILGLTFTNKAAFHLKEKVRRALGPDSDVTVATYHSFAAGLVADHALELDLDPSTQVLNRAQSWQLLYAVFDEFRFQRRSTFSPQLLLNDALTLAARCADHLVPIKAVIADCDDVVLTGRWRSMRDTAEKRRELCQVVAAYERRKRERNLLDFGDQVALAVRLLEEHPAVAHDLRRQRPVVLLDEYQDTNYAQRRMIQLLYPADAATSDEAPAITAVGDDMQSIYGFRGAHLANIRRFTRHFPPVTPKALQTTFRFGPALVELANRIQGQVDEALSKTLRADPGAAATTIECFLAADDTAEADAIADDILRQGAPGECAVLCRKRRLIRPIIDALDDRGVPVGVVGASGLLGRPEVVDLVAWLEVLADHGSTVALLRILQGPRYRIGLRDLATLARHAREHATDGWRLADALDVLDEVPDLGDDAHSRLRLFCAERAALAAVALRQPVLDLAESVIVRTGLWQATDARGRENLLRLLDLAQRFAPVEGDPGLPAFVEYLQLLDESEEDLAEAHESESDAVKVMTIHQAKGLEFPIVYVPGLAGAKGASRIFPDNRAGENALTNSAVLPWWLREDEGIPHPARVIRQSDIDDVIRERRLDEEWRLLYVACTRARRRLVCSAAHWYRPAAEPQGPSTFYEFIAAQTDIVTELHRHDPASVDPEVAAKERRRLRAAASCAAAVPPSPEAAQLQLDHVEMPAPAPPARRAPRRVSVTGLVTYARCPLQFYWTVVRPLPRRSSPAARLGAEVHRWIEQRSGGQLTLLEPDDDGSAVARHAQLPPPLAARLRESFLASPWADLGPVRVEAPFVLPVGRHLVRGRVDAVYERDGRLELVDFKTGRQPAAGDLASRVQLELYGLAAVETWGADPPTLRTTYCWLRGDGPPVVDSTDWDGALVGSVKRSLGATLDRLAAERYEPTPGTWCRSCDFRSFCAAGQAAPSA